MKKETIFIGSGMSVADVMNKLEEYAFILNEALHYVDGCGGYTTVSELVVNVLRKHFKVVLKQSYIVYDETVRMNAKDALELEDRNDIGIVFSKAYYDDLGEAKDAAKIYKIVAPWQTIKVVKYTAPDGLIFGLGV